MAQQWYYADRQRQQRGPVSADELEAAVQRGDADMASLVWHEGLPAWVPLAQVAAGFGLPEAPRRRTRLIVACVLIGCLLAFGGLAAIALPAYARYTARTRLVKAYAVMGMERYNVERFFAANGRCPRNGDDGFGEPASYAGDYLSILRFGEAGDGGCEMRARLRNLGQSQLDGTELALHMDRALKWTGTLDVPSPAGLRP